MTQNNVSRHNLPQYDVIVVEEMRWTVTCCPSHPVVCNSTSGRLQFQAQWPLWCQPACGVLFIHSLSLCYYTRNGLFHSFWCLHQTDTLWTCCPEQDRRSVSLKNRHIHFHILKYLTSWFIFTLHPHTQLGSAPPPSSRPLKGEN